MTRLLRPREDRSDVVLLRDADRDPAAFSVLYERHVEAVYRWLRRRMGWAASDLTAETFARAWLIRHRFRDEHDGSVLPWLMGIAANLLGDGRPAIEIAYLHPVSGPATIYYVDPSTYAPIELDSYGYDSPKDVTRIRFRAYQVLPLAGHRALLAFAVPQSARVDRSPADYWHAAGLATPF